MYEYYKFSYWYNLAKQIKSNLKSYNFIFMRVTLGTQGI